MQLLIVDDETAMREVLYDLLKRKGYGVLTANSGTQALEMLKGQRPQCILLDSKMPGLSGLETAKEIRLFDQGVRIILLQEGGDSDVPEQELRRLGIAETVRKELGIELFLKSLELSLKQAQSAAPPSPATPRVRVPGILLIVDDEPGILRLLKSFFESRGLTVTTATSGEEALTTLTQKPVAVLLDITMPGMDGLMTLKKIKERHAALPVIMISGIGDETTVREALEAGAYDYVTKPFNLEYLETIVLTKVLLGMKA